MNNIHTATSPIKGTFKSGTAVFADAIETAANTERFAVRRRGGVRTISDSFNERNNYTSCLEGMLHVATVL